MRFDQKLAKNSNIKLQYFKQQKENISEFLSIGLESRIDRRVQKCFFVTGIARMTFKSSKMKILCKKRSLAFRDNCYSNGSCRVAFFITFAAGMVIPFHKFV